jgi:hypothetical protein
MRLKLQAKKNVSCLMKNRKCLALSECIVAISKKSFTPFHLGLTLQIHHLHGLKYLMETLNAHGFGL